MSWQDLLQELLHAPRPPKASRLTKLSGISEAQQRELAHIWPLIPVQKRRAVVHMLHDLMEDNLDLDFHHLFLLALDDEDAEVRTVAVRGLWEYEGRDLIPRLLRLLEADPAPEVRAEAALALGQFVLRRHLGRLREKHYRPIEEALRRAIESPQEVPEVRARALEAMGAMGELSWVRDAICAAFESGHRRLRVAAIHAMGRSADPRWLPLLLRELQSDDPEYRYEAALACGAIGDPQAVPHLASLLEDEDIEARQAAIAALGQIGGQEAKDLLLALRDDPSPAIREAVAAALAEIEFQADPLSLRSLVDG